MTATAGNSDSNTARIPALIRRQKSSLDRLVQEPYKFSFFQAVRLLELHTLGEASSGAQKVNLIGKDFFPSSEAVRFQASPTQGFPGSEIMSLEPHDLWSNRAGDRIPPKMVVSFLGLTGPSGVLPQHYTQRLIDELRDDAGMREFFDIFNHRILSLFYRVWKKYQFPIAYESESFSAKRSFHKRIDDRDLGDTFTFGMYSFVGKGTGGLRDRQMLPDEGLLFFAGQLAQHSPNVVSLEAMVGDYFNVPAEVTQFVGQWLSLGIHDRSSLSPPSGGLGNNALGVTAIAGERVWSVENKFRLSLGPLDYSTYWEFLPGNRQLVPLAQFVRTYVGAEYDFEVQLILKQDEIPSCQLGGDGGRGSLLGWNTWLSSESLEADSDDLILQVDGAPILEPPTVT